jgi:hypothetical protein
MVEAPVITALNGIIVRAVVGFILVAALTSLPLLVHLEGPVHEAVHLLLPAGWVVYAVLTGTGLLLRPGYHDGDGDPWLNAAQIDPGHARFARALSLFMLLGWAVSVAAMLVHHHLGTNAAIQRTLLVDVPIMFAVWGLASFAWTRWCAHALARAEAQSTDRLREYWAAVASPH